jgi:hypothetical protein
MRNAAVVLLVALALALPPSAVRAALTVDPHAEVAAALYSASATLAAVERSDDLKLRTQQAQIATLSQKVKAGDAASRAQLVAAQQSFVAELAQKDRAYAQAIEMFRGAVTDIAATPQGAAGLARYNSGDVVGGLAVLDKLQAADEASRQRATDIQKAAGERRIAELAYDARDQGKVDTASVIDRFEAVTRLDPGEFWDWARLDRLY